MADLLSTVYLNQRARVPGSDSTNAPDATLLVINKSLYRWIAASEMSGITRSPGGTFGWTLSAGAGQRSATTIFTTIERDTGVFNEGIEAATVTGSRVEYVDRATYDREVETFPGTNGPTKIGHWYRDNGGSWTILIHPGGQAATNYLSVEGEFAPTDLSSGASTVVLTPQLTEMLVILGAYEIGRLLGRDQGWLDALLATAPNRRLATKWRAEEIERGASPTMPPERHA